MVWTCVFFFFDKTNIYLAILYLSGVKCCPFLFGGPAAAAAAAAAAGMQVRDGGKWSREGGTCNLGRGRRRRGEHNGTQWQKPKGRFFQGWAAVGWFKRFRYKSGGLFLHVFYSIKGEKMRYQHILKKYTYIWNSRENRACSAYFFLRSCYPPPPSAAASLSLATLAPWRYDNKRSRGEEENHARSKNLPLLYFVGNCDSFHACFSRLSGRNGGITRRPKTERSAHCW